ncbi:baseplate J/gp47 family protein [Chelatococcus reniformis]|uniref:Tail protein n=1 Tax=Chelatococcus reniformis TaxID=1494448 RepID=A0A916XGE7_9HYPH|nr:baseplate J/gp47 family protein [Chelatococcus reniformis]GGC68652.1 tail protein [Chelatococcus reniformis]
MPFDIPSLPDLRRLDRDAIAGRLPGAEAAPPNSRLRVMSDRNAAAAYLNLLYLKWLSLQVLPDTAETEWLDRHGRIWVGGRKTPTYAGGVVTMSGLEGIVVAEGTRLSGSSIEFEVLDGITIGEGPTNANVRALTPGSIGNLEAGSTLSLSAALRGVDGQATVVTLSGGTDAESDDDLRTRVLLRIQQPPMGGAAHDYVRWALDVPGVTRAWCSPLEMGMGTVTVRFMMDELRASADPMLDGFPTPDDVAYVHEQMDLRRPVAVKDFFVEAPIPEPVDFQLASLEDDSAATRAAIRSSVAALLKERARPAYSLNGVRQEAQTIYEEWVSKAILDTPDVDNFDLVMVDHVMPSSGHMAVPGTITWPA